MVLALDDRAEALSDEARARVKASLEALVPDWHIATRASAQIGSYQTPPKSTPAEPGIDLRSKRRLAKTISTSWPGPAGSKRRTPVTFP
jgi:hypothetical protein